MAAIDLVTTWRSYITTHMCPDTNIDFEVGNFKKHPQSQTFASDAYSPWSGDFMPSPVSPIGSYNSMVRPSRHSDWGMALKRVCHCERGFCHPDAVHGMCVDCLLQQVTAVGAKAYDHIAKEERVQQLEKETEKKTEVKKKIVYLVRHGEAEHNIVERQAKAAAIRDAESKGLEKGSEAFNAFLKNARAKMLADPDLRDPGLSEDGRRQAVDTRAALEQCAAECGMPLPKKVLVSPLRRTLETAVLAFPDHENVQVSPLLRERRTGFPCDQEAPLAAEARAAAFGSFDFSKLDDAVDGESADIMIEDAQKLRQRTGQLAELLAEVDDDSVCIITHKAWLRELERGPFGREGAAEFETAEVRVYEVALDSAGGMSAELFPETS